VSSSAQLPSPLPATNFGQARAATPADGPATVRVAIFSAPGSSAGLATTPPPVGDRKLSRPFLTALADQEPDAPDPASRFPAPGEVFLGFRIAEELGRGAFARVFLAHQEALAGRPVALKVTLRPTREAQRLARLQHTNVVPVYSVHDDAPAQVICMPYLGRKTIADLIRTYRAHHSTRGIGGRATARAVRPSRTTALAHSKPAPGSDARADATAPAPLAPVVDANESLVGDPLAVVRVLARLADGLAHAHDRGILHLDLKPANVLLADDGEPMLLDFNLSFDATNRERGLVGGTLPYMAIEQLVDLKSRGKGQIDARTDLYSLGVMAYEMLTGTVPFPSSGPNDIETLIADRRAGCPSLRALNPLVTPAIEAIVKKLLAPEPQDRYPSAAALKTDLERHLNNLPLEEVREPSAFERFRKWRRRNPGVIARLFAASVFGLVIGLAAASYMRAEANSRAAATERVRVTRSGLDHVRLDLILPNDPAARARGIKNGEAILATYGLPGDAAWESRDGVRRLADADRAALRADLGELALLVAQAKWREAERKPNPDRLDGASEALKFSRAARRCFAADATPEFLERQVAELTVAAGEPQANAPAARPAGKKPTSRELFLDATAAVSTARYSDAVPMLEGAVAAEPGHASAQFCLAYCRQQLGDDARALERYDVAQALLPNHPLPAYQRGVIYNRGQQREEAEKAFGRAIELDPNLARAHRDRGQVRAWLGKWREAEADYTTALEKGAAPIQIHTLRAYAREHLEDARGAAADRKAAGELVPKAEFDYLVRGYISLKRGNYDAALADFVEAEAMNPGSLIALQNQAHVLADKMNDQEAALEVATRTVKFNPDFVPARTGRAVILARLGKRDEAVREAEKAMAKSNDPEVLYQAACVYALTAKAQPKDAAKAIELLKKAFQSGFKKTYVFTDDRDLEELRKVPEFATLAQNVTGLFGS
jgi:serine/threonine protein kinase/Flp pilus assembly protein TadD